MTLAYQGRSCQARDKRIPRGKIYGAGRTDLSLALSRLGENADANTTRILGEFECLHCNPFPEGNRRPAPPLTMSSWSAQGLPECRWCTSCAGSGYARPGLCAGRRCRRHLVLEPLSRRPLRRREHAVFVLVLRRAAAGMELE